MGGFAEAMLSVSSEKTIASPLYNQARRSRRVDEAKVDCVRLQMPVHVTVQEPRTRIIRNEAESDIIVCRADVDGISSRGVHKVILRRPGSADDIEVMLNTGLV